MNDVLQVFMSEFDHHALENLKKLCRIECTAEEDMDILQSLTRVLGYVEQLSEVDTTNVASCNYVLQTMLKNPMRQDIAEPSSFSREEFLHNAPDQIGGVIRVPPVMKAL